MPWATRACTPAMSSEILQINWRYDKIATVAKNTKTRNNEEKYRLRAKTPSAKKYEEASTEKCEKRKRGPKPKTYSPKMSKYRRKNANARERMRMGEINYAFESLKDKIPLPNVGSGKPKCEKLTKINVLHIAINYIRTLEDILETGELDAKIYHEKLIRNPFQAEEDQAPFEPEEQDGGDDSGAEDQGSPDSGIQEDDAEDCLDWTELSSTLDLRAPLQTEHNSTQDLQAPLKIELSSTLDLRAQSQTEFSSNLDLPAPLQTELNSIPRAPLQPVLRPKTEYTLPSQNAFKPCLHSYTSAPKEIMNNLKVPSEPRMPLNFGKVENSKPSKILQLKTFKIRGGSIYERKRKPVTLTTRCAYDCPGEIKSTDRYRSDDFSNENLFSDNFSELLSELETFEPIPDLEFNYDDPFRIV